MPSRERHHRFGTPGQRTATNCASESPQESLRTPAWLSPQRERQQQRWQRATGKYALGHPIPFEGFETCGVTCSVFGFVLEKNCWCVLLICLRGVWKVFYFILLCFIAFGDDLSYNVRMIHIANVTDLKIMVFGKLEDRYVTIDNSTFMWK